MKKSIILLLGAVSISMLADEPAVNQLKPNIDKLETGLCINSHYRLQFNSFCAGAGLLLWKEKKVSDKVFYEPVVPPEEFDPADEPAKVSFMPIQHAYTASMDIDLSPKMQERKTQLYGDDGFDKMFLEWANVKEEDAKNVNRIAGFRYDDHDYALEYYLWDNTRNRIISPTNSFWGTYASNSTSAIKIFGRTIKSLDGQDDNVSQHDDTYHPHANITKHAEGQDWHQEITHYCMMCGIGCYGGYVVAEKSPMEECCIALPVPKDQKDYAIGFESNVKPKGFSVSKNGKYQFWNTGIMGN